MLSSMIIPTMVMPELTNVYQAGKVFVQRHALVQSLISGLSLSTLITAGLALVKSRADRIERTFKLHGEFSSYEFIKARDMSYALLAKNPALTFQQLVVEEKFEEQIVYLTRLVTFYEHLSISLRSGFIDKKAGCRYFGMVFLWWYVIYFDTPRGLHSTQWEAANDLHALFVFFKKHAKSKDFDNWMKNATNGSSFEKALQVKEQAVEQERLKVTHDPGEV